nr:multidrug effflux MFS transporter [uncultured Gellertiella sp.]
MATLSKSAADRLKNVGRNEFIAMMAALMALNALAIDIMLPGLQQIGASLGVTNENHRQYVITAYLIGFGIAQLAYGPISDRFGRRIPLLTGLGIYIAAGISIIMVPSFGLMLGLRFVQGLGSAAMRVITVSIVRDIFGGRQMAEAMSLIMMVFMVAPVLAPGTGQVVMLFGNWHLIFVFISVVATIIGGWAFIRLPETLDPRDVRPLNPRTILDGFRIVLTNRIAFCYTLSSTFIYGALFGFINSAQQIYVGIYGLGLWFPVAFAAVAAFMSMSSFLNSKLVGRFGMRRLSHGALLGFVTVNAIWLVLQLLWSGPMPFPLFITFFGLSMFQFGWIGSNFNSMAMEPLGHVAGTASSVLGFMGTVGGALIGAAIGQAFNGTALPMVAGFFAVSIMGLLLVLIAEKGMLFRAQNKPA